MADRLLIETLTRKGWAQMLVHPRTMPPGSMSSYPPEHERRRQIIVFGWHKDLGVGVWESIAGVDVEVGIGRLVGPLAGMRRLADLEQGPFEFTVYSAVGPRKIRITLI